MLAVCATLLLSFSARLQAEKPFAELRFEAARDKAKSEKKLLFVDFTAVWCEPCRRMEKDTWGSADVCTWLRANAIAIQVDVGEERELGVSFKIDALPTVIVLRDGAEFDRVEGYEDSTQFLAWGRDVLAGKSTKDKLVQRAKEELLQREKGLHDSTDVRARHDLARDLAHAGCDDEALYHFLWLWPATRSAKGFGGVRVSYMLDDMAQLAKRSEAAKAAFGEIFEGLQAKIDAAAVPTFEDWHEWTAFCQYFDAKKRLVTWYEKRRDAEGRLLAEQQGSLADLIVSDVYEALLQAERPLDAVQLFADVRPRARGLVDRYRRYASTKLDGLDAEARQDIAAAHERELTSGMSQLYAALLLADRAQEATDVAALLLQTLDAPEARMELVRQGLALAKKVDPSYARWLDEADAAGKDTQSLRRELERLEKDGGK